MGYGTQINALLEAADRLEGGGISAEVVKLNAVTPSPRGVLFESVKKTGMLLIAEESMDHNCVGRRVTADLSLHGITTRKITLLNLGDKIPPQGTVEQLRRMNGLDAESIVQRVKEVAGREKAFGCSSG